MKDISLDGQSFPEIDRGKVVRWAPLLLHPRHGSPETFVIGVIAASDESAHFSIANSLDRFRCLYGDESASLFLALETLAAEMDRRVQDFEGDFNDLVAKRLPIGEAMVGPISETAGLSETAIADTWLKDLSSLHSAETAALLKGHDSASNFLSETVALKRPAVKVMDIVLQRSKDLLPAFHSDIREGKVRRSRRHGEVIVDFLGQKISANIEALRPSKGAGQAGVIKQRMWDLAVQRDRLRMSISPQCEMLVLIPEDEQARATTRQVASLKRSIENLTDQADREQIRLRAMGSARKIADHLIEIEG